MAQKYCPGFMCVPRKPHPFGNEYHLIADGDDGKPVMWWVKLIKGKDQQKKTNGSSHQSFQQDWENEDNYVGDDEADPWQGEGHCR